ncbi:MAG: site-specific integrase [Euryarchaeota archaeon]|nr:site-specific integrase [Euryarchaeota archaeon]
MFCEERLKEFVKWLEVNENKAPITVYRYKNLIMKIIKSNIPIHEYIENFKRTHHPNGYKNLLKALRNYAKFLKNKEFEEFVKGFRFPSVPFQYEILPSKEEIIKFYNEIRDSQLKAIFLMLISSGLRINELLGIRAKDIVFKRRIINASLIHNGTTKFSYIAFFNEEAEKSLKEYLNGIKLDADSRIFTVKARNVQELFNEISKRLGIKITPKTLRKIFTNELGRKRIPDRFIDAFCGRIPNSTIAKHYSDFSPENLKQIYDGADLKVLSRTIVEHNGVVYG